MIMATSRVLANQRNSLPVLQIENFIFHTIDIDGDVAACYGRMTNHDFNPFF
jgi:hypothetical protein